MLSQSIENKVMKKVLPNGLTVLLKADHSNPVVAINVWFGVGSVNETEEMTGLAHFQEHMVFKGTEKYGVGEIANLVKSAGGNLNAGTSYSYTMYYVVLPSRAFSLALSVQADAMMNSTFDPDEFQRERLVVIDEARMYDDTPDSYTFYRMMELGFNVHNYRRPIAGYEDVVRKITRDQLLEFYNMYYRPSNAVLAVVGDIDSQKAMAEIESVYGGWRDSQAKIHTSPVEPPQEGFRYRLFRGSIDHAYLGIGYHVSSILDRDYPALEMLSSLLGSGKSSRLYRRVLEDKHLVTTVGADLLAEKWPGYFMIFASCPPEKWMPAGEAIVDELERFKKEPVGDDELIKARRQIQRGLYSELETMEGQASNLGYYELLGDYRLAEQHREAISKVTQEEILAVAKKYFDIENCSLVSYLPKGEGVALPDADAIRAAFAGRANFVMGAPSKGPPGPPPRARHPQRRKKTARTNRGQSGRPPKVSLVRLDNGLRVLVKRRTTIPMVSMLTLIQGGIRLEPKGKSGISILTSRALLKGTSSYDVDEIVDIIEGLGGSVESFSSFDAGGVYINMLCDHLDEALPVYREILRDPRFLREQVEKEKSKLLKELAKRHDNPVLYSMDTLFARVFGDHPYAHPFLGDESQLIALTDEDCRLWYQRVLVPENMVVVFVGDITMKKALAVARNLFDDLPRAAVPTPDCAAPEVPVNPGMHELTRTNLKQAVGLVGFTAPPMMTEEAISLEVLNGILTGLGGRLFVELRDKRSLGYMAGSALVPLRDRSIFFAYSNPGPDGIEEALGVILSELARARRDAVTSDEIKRSKEWLIGSQVMRLQRNFAQAVAYGTFEALGFGYEAVDRTPGLIQRVTEELILKAAGSVFDEEKAVFIKLLPELETEPARE